MVHDLAQTRRRAWLVRSSRPLEGEVAVAGAKNTITKLMIASCLASGTSELGNVPEISEPCQWSGSGGCSGELHRAIAASALARGE